MRAVGPVDDLDVVAFGPQIGGDLVDERPGVVGAVIEDLDLVPAAGVVHTGGGFDDAAGDGQLVIKRELGRDARPSLRRRLALVLLNDLPLLGPYAVPAAVRQEHEDVHVETVEARHRDEQKEEDQADNVNEKRQRLALAALSDRRRQNSVADTQLRTYRSSARGCQHPGTIPEASGGSAHRWIADADSGSERCMEQGCGSPLN